MDGSAAGSGQATTVSVGQLLAEAPDAAAPVLAGVLDTLDARDLGSLASAEVISVVQAWERLSGWVAEGQARALRALEASSAAEAGPDVDENLLDAEVTEEVALALRLSARSAGGRLSFAEALGDLPRVALGLHQGRLSVGHARVLADLLCSPEVDLPARTREQLEREMVDLLDATHLTPGQLRRRARSRLLALDPDAAAQRRQRAVRGRDVSWRADDDGMAWLSAYLPAQVAQACFGLLDGFARSSMPTDPDDTRGLGARRADALVDRLMSGQLDGSLPPDAAPPVRPAVTINVTVPVSSLAGLDDDPGELDGYGAIDAELVRTLAASDTATWRRLLTEPLSGTLLDVGTRTYRPPAGLDRHVRLRDQQCRWPGCDQPASRCDLDHTVAWPQGPTAETNIVSLCRRHHRLKTLARFTTTQARSSWTVRTPSGRTFTTRPMVHTPPGVYRIPAVLRR